MKVKPFLLSAGDDPEKAILPTILLTRIKYCTTITLGWWHWGIGIAFVTTKTPSRNRA